MVVYLVTTLLQIFHKMCWWQKLKIGQYLAKIWLKVGSLLFSATLHSNNTEVRRRHSDSSFLYIVVNKYEQNSSRQ